MNDIGKNDDFLRLEIKCAIDKKRNVIPLTFGSFDFANEDIQRRLTDELKHLKEVEAIRVSHDSFQDHALQKLVKMLETASWVDTEQPSPQAREIAQMQQEKFKKFFIESSPQSLIEYLKRRTEHWCKDDFGKLDSRFVSLTLRIDDEREYDSSHPAVQTRYKRLSDLLTAHPDVGAWVLVGAPGSGKSTVMQHYEMSASEAAWRALEESEDHPGAAGSGSNRPEVCLLYCLSWDDADKSPPPAEWLTRPEHWPPDLPPLDKLRTVARVRFLLDGLNEIKAPDHARQLQAVEAWTEWAANEANREMGLAPVFNVRTLDRSVMSSSGSHFEVRKIELEPWDSGQIQDYCVCRLGQGNALWEIIRGDAKLLELSSLPFNLRAICELSKVGLAGEVLERATVIAGMFWLMLELHHKDAPLQVPNLLSAEAHNLIEHKEWRKAPHELPDPGGCLVPWLDHAMLRLQCSGRQVSVTESDLLKNLPPVDRWATPAKWLVAVLSLQLIEKGGYNESYELLLRCVNQLWQEFFAARRICELAVRDPKKLPDLRPLPLPDLDETLQRLGRRETLPGLSVVTRFDVPVVT